MHPEKLYPQYNIFKTRYDVKAQLPPFLESYPARNYMFKGNNRNPRARCEICLKLTKTPERR